MPTKHQLAMEAHTDEMWGKLSEPFPQAAISWRPGATTQDKKKCIALAYIDARDVMDRLDEAAGPSKWSDDYKEVMGRIVCTITLYCPDGFICTKSDGAGDSDIESEKGGLSDAFKRAAVKLGIGRYLYRLDAGWVQYDELKKKIVKPPTLPAWALPSSTTMTGGETRAKQGAEQESATKTSESAPAAVQPKHNDTPATPFTGDFFAWLKLLGPEKKRIGDSAYYRVLKLNGVAKANTVNKKDFRKMGEVLAMVKAQPDLPTLSDEDEVFRLKAQIACQNASVDGQVPALTELLETFGIKLADPTEVETNNDLPILITLQIEGEDKRKEFLDAYVAFGGLPF